LKHNNNEEIGQKTTRIEAFSDGVFSIAITLLVLELIGNLHSENQAGLLNSFLSHRQSFLAFLIGFITILVCWINHNAAFEDIRKIDTNMMWINGFLLFLVTLTPFPTAILAEYLDKESTVALLIFGFNYVLISFAAYSICAYAYKHHLVKIERREYYYFYLVLYRYSIFYTLAAFALCFISSVIPIVLYVILFTVFAAPKIFASWLWNRSKTRKKNYGKTV
jgi:uncharacterized membrane protein